MYIYICIDTHSTCKYKNKHNVYGVCGQNPVSCSFKRVMRVLMYCGWLRKPAPPKG